MAIKRLLTLGLFLGFLNQLDGARIVLHAVNGTVININEINVHKTTISHLKELIQEKEGTRIKDQRLMFDRKLLNDDSCLMSDLDLYNLDYISITMMDNLKQNGLVYVETGKKIIPIFIKENDTIKYLKSLVGEVSEFNHKRIFFDGVELEDDSKTLAEYKIYKGAHIRIFNQHEVFPVIIKTLTGETITLDIETTLDVGGLKHIIEEKEGTPRFEQRILVHKNILLDDELEVISYCNQPSEGLLLVMANPLNKGGNVNVYFVPNQQNFTVYIEPNTTSEQLKDVISKQTNIPKQELVLEFQRKELEGNKKLTDYKLYEGCSIKALKKTHL